MLSEMESQKESPKDAKQIHWRPWLLGSAIAAGLALLILLLLPSEINPDTLYATYYQPLQASNQFRNSTEELPEGIRLYQQGDFQAAIPELKSLIKERVASQDRIYLGIAYLEESRIAEASRTFTSIVQAPRDPFEQQHAVWYLALISLKSGKLPAARQAFKEIRSKKGIYSEQAEKIMEALD